MNMKELKTKCKELKIKGYSGKKKDELLALIKNTENPENKNTIETKSDNQNIIEIDWTKEKSALSLFSGMGGDTLGLQQGNLDVVLYSEKMKQFQMTHEENFSNSKLIGGDITKITDETFLKYKNKLKLIFAGFPCQSFSNAGKKNPNDPRGTLFKEFVRATKLIEPDYIIGENVKGLLSRKTGTGESVIDIIVEEFEKLDFNVIYKVFKTEKYGVPQKRERLIILGVKKHLNKLLKFPDELNTSMDLKNIVKFNMNGAIKINSEDFDMTNIPEECILTDMNNDETENNVHPYLKVVAKGRNFIYNDKPYPIRLSFAKRDSSVHSEIIDIRKPSKTIICTYEHQPRLFVPLKNKNGYYLRCLLPDELKQIQGFPSDYKLTGSLKEQIIQIGNAVPPPLIKQIVDCINN